MRRGLGRGRLLIGSGAVLAVIGMPLPWYTVGGEVLPAVSGHGFDGAGVLVFLAAVGMLALVALPYASRSRQSALDRATAYGALAAVGLAGLGLELVTSWNEGWLGTPDRAPGLWLAGVGMLLAGWGAAEVFAEKPAPL
jgi:hypothetical protein